MTSLIQAETGFWTSSFLDPFGSRLQGEILFIERYSEVIKDHEATQEARPLIFSSLTLGVSGQ